MKHVVKVICLLLSVVMTAGALLCGCEKQNDAANEGSYAKYNLSEYIQVGPYKGVEISPFPYELTEDVIQQQLAMAVTNYAKQEEKQDAIENGDQVVIDFTGYVDGELFEGGSATDYPLTIGSGAFIPGFEAGLLGAKAGDTVTLDIAFPDPYTVNPDLAGKPVRFEVKINKVLTYTIPEYNDAFVQKYYGYDTVAEFEIALRDSVQEQYDANKRYYAMTEVWTKVVDGTQVLQYPEAEYQEVYDANLAPYTTAASNASMTLGAYLELAAGITESELLAQIDEIAKGTVKEEMIFRYIVEQENITLSDAEYKKNVEDLVAARGLESLEEMLELYGATEETLRESMLFDKMMEVLVGSSVTKNTAQ